MRHQILIGVLLIPAIVSSQVRIQNLTLTVPDTNIFYIGIDNHIKISGLKDYSQCKLLIGGEVYSEDLEEGVVFRTATMGKVEVKVVSKSKTLLIREFNRQLLPWPKSSLTFFADTVLSINSIRANPKVVVYLPNCVARLTYRVIAFKVDLIANNGSYTESFDILSDQLPSDILGRLQSGDKLRFYELRVVGPDDARYSSFEISVK